MSTRQRHWYITLLAAGYAIIGGCASIRYILLHFRADSGDIPVIPQLLCFALTISAVLYFWRARLGHVMLAVLTGLTILAIGYTDVKATAFHYSALAVLLLPLALTKCKCPGKQAPAEEHALLHIP